MLVHWGAVSVGVDILRLLVNWKLTIGTTTGTEGTNDGRKKKEAFGKMYQALKQFVWHGMIYRYIRMHHPEWTRE